jgi:CspA family cold shock protein
MVSYVAPVNEKANVPIVGKYVGQCKWFSDKLGYGFITIQQGDETNEKGHDIFVHHSGINPRNSNYKTLKKGEYINFNIIDGDSGLQCVDITGIGGGTLMCDYSSSRPSMAVDTSAYRNHNPVDTEMDST